MFSRIKKFCAAVTSAVAGVFGFAAVAHADAVTDATAAIATTQSNLVTILGAMLGLGIALWGIKKVMRYFRG